MLYREDPKKLGDNTKFILESIGIRKSTANETDGIHSNVFEMYCIWEFFDTQVPKRMHISD